MAQSHHILRILGMPSPTGNALEFLRLNATEDGVEWAAGGAGYTDENAQDAINAMLVDTATINFTYTDATPELKFDLIVGGTDNTETNFMMWDGDSIELRTLASLNIPTVTPAALTKTDDTNVTLTLGGTPGTALLQATSLTLGWSGQLSMARGGTGANLSDPGSDHLLFWDDSAGSMAFLTLGTNLSITGTTINASGGGTPGGNDTEIQFNDGGAFNGDPGFIYAKTTNTFSVGSGNSGIIELTGNCDVNAVGPLIVKSTGTGITGTALTLDATSDTNGKKWSFISTGAPATPGAGHFAFYTPARGYVALFQSDGRVRIGNANPTAGTDLGSILQVTGDSIFTNGVIINYDGADSDTTIKSDTHADAFFLDATDGAITIGAYGGGTITGTEVYLLGVTVGGKIVEVTPSVGGYTDEQAQDAVNTMLVDTATINFTYTDATPELKFDLIVGGTDNTETNFMMWDGDSIELRTLASLNIPSQYTDELAQDAVFTSALVLTNGLTGAYNDGANTYTAKLGGTLVEITTIDTDGFIFGIIDGATELLVIDSTGDGYSLGKLGGHHLVIDNGNGEMRLYDTVSGEGLIIDTAASTTTLNTTEILFTDGTLAAANNGYVWTLIDDTTGEGGWAAAPGGSAHVIQENGGNLTNRANLNFEEGLIATDDSGDNATNVNIVGWNMWREDSFTSSATGAQTAESIATPTDSKGILIVHMVASADTSNDGLSGAKYVHWENVSGTATVLHVTDSEADFLVGWTTATWTVDASGANLRIRVTPENTDSTGWYTSYQMKYKVFTP